VVLALLCLLPLAPVAGGGSVVVGATGDACPSQPALADGLAQADVVFVGSVIFLENSDRWVIVNVEERWKGAGALGESIEVRGSGDPGSSTLIDRTYEQQRYLFAVAKGEGHLVDNLCTATTPWSDALARLRPDGVEAAPGLAVASPIDDVNMDVFLPVVGLLAALGIVLIAYVIILRARKRGPDWMR
jgi:hypothetical protein